MKKIVVVILLVVSSCSKNPDARITHLNGYWEIDEVTLVDGSKRDYNYNQTIDFISINDSFVGFRKKLMPNLDGSFSTSNDAESLVLKIENDSLNIYYKTPYAEWKEAVLEATNDKLLIQNRDGVLYLYKRYQSLEFD